MAMHNWVSGKMLFHLGAGVLLLTGGRVQAQEIDEIAKKYKSEQAVISSIREQLVITGRDGKLQANSNVQRERVLIGEQSPGLYNTEYIYHSYFNKLEEYDEVALVPAKKGYKKVRSASSKTTHAEQNNIFYDDAKQTAISFSGLAPGSMLRTSYTISHTDVHMLPSYYFQENLRVDKSVFEVTAPNYVDMRFVLKGSNTDRIVQSKQEHKNTTTYTFTAKDLDALKDYDDVPSVAWHGLHVVPYIAGYKLPGEEHVDMLSDPAHLYTYFYEFIRHVNIKKDEHITTKVLELTQDDKTQREKAAHIYQWVQEQMHYVAFEDSLGGFIPRQAADVYKRKFGDCKDMASILVAMCREAGIKAYFTWIGTRSKPYTYEETPLPIVDNHMICAAEIDGEWILMDGTHPLIPFGEVPSSLQGKEAMVGIDETHYKIIPVPETNAEKNRMVDSTYVTIEEKALNGRSVMDFEGYMSWNLQISMLYTRDKDREQATRSLNTRGSNKYVQNSYEYLKSVTGYKNSSLSATFTIDDYVQRVGKEVYVNMNLKRNFDGSTIDTQDRVVPYYFKYKDIEDEVVVLDIPAGYKVSYMPKEASGTLNDIWSYSINYKMQDNKVILAKNYQIRSMSVPLSLFAKHNQMVQELQKQYKESIVLIADK